MLHRTLATLATLLLAACGPAQPSTGDETSTDPSTGAAPTTEPGPGSSTSGSIGGTTVVDGTTTPDDATSVGSPDVPPDVPPECIDWATRGCGSTRMPTAVSGTTPLGDFDTSLAVFGGNMTCQLCEVVPNIESITLAADPGVIEALDPDHESDETLVLRLGSGFFDGPTQREVVGMLLATRNGITEHANAMVVVDSMPTVEELMEPFDPRTAVVVTGTLTAEGDGWSVAGTFAASYCPAVNVAYPCD